MTNELVSVPLRGYGFEIGGLSRSDCYSHRQEFPSPYGDMVLKSLRWDALLCLAQYAVLRRGCIFPPFHSDATF